MRERHGFKKYKCNQCNFRSDEQSNVLKHVKFIHEDINFKCDQCDFKCIRKDNLKQHIKFQHLENKIKTDMDYLFSQLNSYNSYKYVGNYIISPNDFIVESIVQINLGLLNVTTFLQIRRNYIIYPVL